MTQRARVHSRLLTLKSERFSANVTTERKAELDKGIAICEAALAIGDACEKAIESLQGISKCIN